MQSVESAATSTILPTCAPINRSFEPDRWTDRSQRDRLLDLRAVIDLIANDPQLGPAVDVQRVGLIGHSLGGYTALGMAGGWPSWKHSDVKAVLALSPYVLPFIKRGTLARLDVPVMYQGAQFDCDITPSLEGTRGAYAADAAAEVFREANRGHAPRVDQPSVFGPTKRRGVSKSKAQRVSDRSLWNRISRSTSEEQTFQRCLRAKARGWTLYRFELP